MIRENNISFQIKAFPVRTSSFVGVLEYVKCTNSYAPTAREGSIPKSREEPANQSAAFSNGQTVWRSYVSKPAEGNVSSTEQRCAPI